MKKLLARLKKDQRGLTLVELLAVIVILAIVGAIAFVIIGNVIDNSKKDAHIANAQQLINAAKLYEASGNEIGGGVTLAELQGSDNIGSMKDPWDKGSYSSGTVTKDNDNKYSVTLSGTEADKKCPISTRTEDELNQGRDTVCAAKEETGGTN